MAAKVAIGKDFPECIYLLLPMITSSRQSNIREHDMFERFLFNDQPDALIIQIYSVIKLYMYRAYSLPIIRSFILTLGTVKFHAGLMTASK
jgi:hypothetical protein